ncbi:MAG: OmpA family protein [Candidatus Manganitrophus sp.]|nr:OmpA family protein [Candidatus Manganitrophus sp.]
MSDILKNVKENSIRIEGHTDNVPIGSKLAGKFPSNWELSASRATQVVRYLSELGVSPENLSAVGLAEYQPVAPNDTPEGKQRNRRIEIVLYPKDIQEIVSSVDSPPMTGNREIPAKQKNEAGPDLYPGGPASYISLNRRSNVSANLAENI